jgi:glycerol kinase
MTRADLILAIDQGTSSSKAILVDQRGRIVARGTHPLRQSHPRPGWVEQSALDLWDSVRYAVDSCLRAVEGPTIAAVALSNQRESLVAWTRATGDPVSPVISWQDRRTAALCGQITADGHGDRVRAISGLPLDPMFSATKATWLLDDIDPDRSRSSRGEICLGTIDSWLLSRFAGDHIVEIGNASRTQLLDVRVGVWAADLLDVFAVPAAALPRIAASTGPFPVVRQLPGVPDGTPIATVLGDSHAALYAHAGWRPGQVKATYGTGSSIMGVAKPTADLPGGVCLTIAWQHGKAPVHAVEGNIRSSGSTLSWLADTVGRTPGELAELATGVSSDGVYIVPAFAGLAAPWWNDRVRGMITGLSFGTGLPQLARAALESVAFQVEDVVAAVETASPPIHTLLADGGASANPVLMQLQANLSGRAVHAATDADLSSLGAAHLAGYAIGIWSADELESLPRPRRVFTPLLSDEDRRSARAGWREALATAGVAT